MTKNLFSLKKGGYSFFFFLLSVLLYSQNAIVGTGFSTGWNSSCTDVSKDKYFSQISGTSYGITTTATGTGNQYFRLGVDWSGSQYTVSGAGSSGTNNSVTPATTYSVNATCDLVGTMFYNVPNVAYNYVFKTSNAGTTVGGNSFVFFEVQGAVRTVSSVTRSNPIPNNNVTVTSNLSGALSTGQSVYLRYSTNSYSTSTVVKMTGSGTTYTANIPSSVNTAGTSVSYYTFTSGDSNVASDGSNADLYTINFNNNSGSNYSYTISSNPVTVESTGGTSTFATYASLSAAITAINGGTIHTGTITTYVNSAYTETAPSTGYILTATGTAANPIKFIKTGSGANPIFTATNSWTAGSKTDGIFKIVGGDYITVDGLDFKENSANTVATAASNTMTEFGIGIFLASATNGAKNNTIQNCNITLSSATAYQNAIGIFSSSASSQTNSALAASATTGTNTSNKIYSNIISGVAYGIYIVSPANTSSIIENGWDIGGSSASTGNTITFGNATTSDIALTSFSATYPAAITFRNAVTGNSVRFNTITSNNLSYGQTTGLGGIVNTYGTAPTNTSYTSTISDNNITLSNLGTTGTTGIDFGFGLSTTTFVANNNIVNVNQSVSAASSAQASGIVASYTNLSSTISTNTINITHSNTGTGALSGQAAGIYNYPGATVSGSTQTITNNIITFKQNTPTSTGTYTGGLVYIFSNASSTTVATGNINNNQMLSSGALRNTGSTVGIYHDYTYTSLTIDSNILNVSKVSTSGGNYGTYSSTSGSTVASTITNNQITFSGLAGSSSAYGIYEADGAGATSTTKNINSNTINISGTSTGSTEGILTGYSKGNMNSNSITINNASTLQYGLDLTGTGVGAYTVSGNTLNMVSSSTGTVSIRGIYAGASTSSAFQIYNNTFTNIESSGGGSAVPTLSAISILTGGNSSIYSNTFTSLKTSGASATGAHTIWGISTSAGTNTIYNNNITNISTAATSGNGTVNGIFLNGGTNTVYKNKIYDLSTAATGTSTLVSGITLASGSSGNIYNNIIGFSNAFTGVNSADAVRGINISSTTTSATYGVYYNTIYLNTTSTGTNFGTTGIFHQISSTATTAALDLRNNIIVNNSTANGTGRSVAYRRSSATLTNYSANSNNNDFYAANIYYDGTTAYTTLAAYKTAMSTRDQASISENPTFASTTGSASTYLHIDNTSTTNLDAGGAPVSGITDDFDADTRNTTTPDIGADEFTLVPKPLDAGITAVDTSAVTCPGSATASVTLKNYGTTTLTSVTINWSVNGAAQTPISWTGSLVQNATTSVSLGAFTYNAATTYTIIASTSSPNAGVDGNTANDSNTSASFRTGLSGTYTVGAGGDFITLTVAVSTANTKGLCGPTVFSLTDALYTTSETFPITINSLTGASATNTLTIKPATGATPIIRDNNATGIIILDGANYVIIDGSNTTGGSTKNLTIRNNNAATGVGVGFRNGASNNVIKYNNILTAQASTTTYTGSVTFSTSTAAAGNNNNTIQENKFGPSASLPTIAVYNLGSSTAKQNTNNTITKNDISDFAYAGIYDAGFSSGFTYDGNLIYGTQTQTSTTALFGVFFNAATIYSPVIKNNKIYNLQSTTTNGGVYGVNFYDIASGTVANLFNNMISLSGGSSTSILEGIIDQTDAGTINIYYNSVNIFGTASSTSSSYAYDKSWNNASVVKNNIFSNTRVSSGTGKQYGIQWIPNGTLTSDYNNIYSSGNTNNTLGLYNSATASATLSDWQTATSKDTNSLSILPSFVSTTDLHITAGCSSLESAGTPISGITTDYDAETRSTTTPDIGADEFTGSIPPKVTSVTDGENCGTGSVLLTANSTDPLVTGYNWYTVATGGTAVNGATPTTSNWSTPSLSTTTNYYVAAYNGTCESDTRILVTATIKPAPTDVVITPTVSPSGAADACATEYVKLDAAGGVVNTNLLYAFGTQAAQNNTTTSTAFPAPYTLYYGGQRMQILIKASELTAAGYVNGAKITNIQFPVVSLGSNWGTTVTANKSFQVSIGNTALSALTTTFQGGLTQVVAPGDFTPTVGYNNTHTFSTPFVWNGTSNIIIETTFSNNITGVTNNIVTQYNSPTSYVATAVYRADGVTATAAAAATTATYSYSARPDFKLNGTNNTQNITWSPATGLYTDAALSTPYVSGNFATTLYAAPDTATSFTATSTLGTCSKTATTSSISADIKSFTGADATSPTLWNVAANWNRNQIPTSTKCVTIPTGKNVVININNAAAKNLIIAGTGTATIQANMALSVTDNITVPDNALVLESDASLLQVNGSAVNTGKINAKRDVKMRTLDYTYWSSPVKDQVLLNTVNVNAANSSGGFSEGTPNNRTYYYNETNDKFYPTTDAKFLNAKGYAIRGKSTYGSTPTSDTSLKFIGEPNNGSYSINIQKSPNSPAAVEHGYNMIGNPYPSNIDFVKFFYLGNNSNVINAKAWFWTNVTPTLNQDGSSYTGNNYATITLTGGTPPTYIDTTVTPSPGSGAYIPTKNIKVGQGFIVQAKNIGTAQALTFDNTIRTNESGLFFNNKNNSSDVNRYWVKLTTPSKIVNTILIGYIDGATNQYDANYDADLLSVGDDSFYSKLNTQKLQIQARVNPLNIEDIVPLGTKYSSSGSYKISLGNREGVFESENKIYLLDKLNNTYTDLTAQDYTFTANKGTDETRFEIVYKNKEVLSADDLKKSDFIVYRDGQYFVIKSTNSLGNMELYDVSGKLISSKSSSQKEFRWDANAIPSGVYIIRAENSGNIRTKKIVK